MSGLPSSNSDEKSHKSITPAPENEAVGQLSELLALECGYTPAEAMQIRMAAVLHDCGKAGIPKNILDKPGKLTAQEFEIMKQHTKIGLEMLSGLHGAFGEMAKNIALHHHEFWNGHGYWGVPSHTLPLYVGIVGICDVLAALLYSRVYKPSWPPDEALAFIKSQAGTQFCPELTDTFISLVRNDNRLPTIFTGVIK